MKEYKYYVYNLDCPNCARKIQEKINKNKKFSNCIVNFNTGIIKLSSESDFSINEINKIVKSIEKNSYVDTGEGKNSKPKKEYHLLLLVISLIFGITGLYININNDIISEILVIISYILLLYRPFINGVKLLIFDKSINENMLIFISCIGAYFIKETFEGIMVVALYTVGKILEEKAVNNSRNSISDLINIKQEYANRKISDNFETIDVEEIKEDDILLVKVGERIPVDGVILSGSSKLDTSALTGESELSSVNEGSNVISGCINLENIITMKAVTNYKDCTVSKILDLVLNATDKKAKVETFVSKFSKVYTPLVLLLAILVVLLLPLLPGIGYSESLYRGLTFLVISCPCAIAISVPLSYFTGIGVCSKKGILIKGSNYLDELSHINKVIFDKTGTITTGSFYVKELNILSDSYTKDEILNILLSGESLSNHPIAKSIMKLNTDNKVINNKEIKDFKEFGGKGIQFNMNNKVIKIGTSKLCNCENDDLIHINIDNENVANLKLDDGIKEDAYDFIEYLKRNKIETFMFTGDKKDIANEINSKLKIDKVYSEMLPTQKYEEYERIENEFSEDTICYIGDGINDAPVLKRAKIGISMGSIGSSSAIEASDIVIMTDKLSKIEEGISISRFTKFIIKQNLIFAISIKAGILLLSIFGLTKMWFAVFADTGLTLLTILNTLRIFKKH